MPVYADEPEFNYEDQLTQIQQLNSIGELSVDYKINETPVEISDNENGLVRSPSINPTVPFEYYGFSLFEDENDNIYGSFNFSGNLPEGYPRFIIYFTSSSGSSRAARGPNYITSNPIPNDAVITSVYIANEEDLSDKLLMGTYNIVASDNIGQTIGNDVNTMSYLTSVQQVFTWILSHITELITFILGNAFLAVGLVLFMCGAVISFFVRIKRA